MRAYDEDDDELHIRRLLSNTTKEKRKAAGLEKKSASKASHSEKSKPRLAWLGGEDTEESVDEHEKPKPRVAWIDGDELMEDVSPAATPKARCAWL